MTPYCQCIFLFLSHTPTSVFIIYAWSSAKFYFGGIYLLQCFSEISAVCYLCFILFYLFSFGFGFIWVCWNECYVFIWMSFVSLNADCTRLLVSHVRGQILMWDVTSGKVLRTITNIHPPGVSVLRVRFTEDRTLAVSNDSSGSVFLLEFKRLIGVRTCDFQCLFSGSRGEVLCAFQFLEIGAVYFKK